MATPGIRPLVAGNWKMNGSLAMASALVGALKGRQGNVDLLVCPPFPYLAAVGAALAGSKLALGAQDCHADASGAHTGDVAAPMLADLGCSYVILGHSERRTDHGETSGMVAAKAQAALAAGLTAIICVGETEAQRNAGEELKIVEKQIVESVPSGANAGNTVIAYEPVWAIGTGKTPTAADVEAMHRHIRALLKSRVTGGAGMRILYGGSVKPSNAAELMAVAEVNGALVGGASLKAEDFWGIAEGAAKSAG
ncbi:triose-phosphate isomerase [Dongia rigui]|uniref:Triosephosphate isomerase n=1 Tax=Dongia rigui TaxID=940149 RepID=A0ABU5E3J4_9PROT|nr:triose-phosphate isomerase [Dongia rigui]MDY0874044.1 triose-phosphate isomerase [Dongia rigui]